MGSMILVSLIIRDADGIYDADFTNGIYVNGILNNGVADEIRDADVALDNKWYDGINIGIRDTDVVLDNKWYDGIKIGIHDTVLS